MASIEYLNELYNNSNFEEILLEAEKIGSDDLNLEIKIIKTKALRKLGRYTDAMDVLSSIQLTNNDLTINKLNYYTIELDVLTHMGKYDDGKNRINIITDLLKKIEISELSTQEKLIVAQTYNELARLNFFLSDYNLALEYLHLQLDIAKELNDKEKITSSLQNIGSTYVSLGKYVESVDYFTQAISIAEDLSSTHLISHIEDNLGLVYYYQGKLDLALKRLNSSLEINKKIKDPRGMGFNYEYIGSVKLKQNKINEAISNYEKSYEIRIGLGNDTHIASIIFALITANLDIGEREKAFEYLQELESILSKTETKRIRLQYYIAKGVYLKDSKRFRNKAQAEQLLRSVIDEPQITEFSLTVTAYLHLIDILYDQIQKLELSDADSISGEAEDIFNEIEEYTKSIGEIAKSKNLPDLQVSHFNIKGFIAISKFEVDTAYAYFNKAEEICRNHDLDNLRFQFKEVNLQAKSDTPQELVMNKEAFPLKIQKSLNKIIHSLPRLLIVTTLLKNIELTFKELQDLTKMSPGNLGKHCDKLINSGYVFKKKEFIEERFLTIYSLTPEGLNEFNRYKDILIPFLSSVHRT